MKKTLLLLSATALLSSATCSQKDTDPEPKPEVVIEPTPLCLLVPDAGICNAAFVRYYFDQREKKCKPFTWGGCGGIVPFNTLEECKACGCK
ncbi:BPTI/Kunitz domain-containing protein [Hymenobacter aerilatus]|uniref:BPTI/Kunitz domain-containing protein n=1 Tax=Hymenobacter aerilatus TaxID=2932251 RepID=A0A8T9SP50_9BACT|nr:BPTI/Kunitz domain-containing protein [Hymenobacter aerilatus]UOR03908.1 BPTI/Kunitz domain-containing protein [Hymenobacter aerilatus]